ncbi:NADPH-dependent FMN reductase [Emticicia sp. CRIBPO]|jgi:chromate reductase, NAD(P)H dehydrogenase (quinone)|uniref:NADPH-dependent FMN reductase n=1 Tax=Emticicia sp. CRIBPO TaxID=2683258 RepID=UPI001411ED43|nr:NAD(P)H-dependent oxidoreductase [Emticicia sp. CRIBPO]NBA88840.1 NADPH-dependent FMN reductase [Emticicia sp. CRIBPO]
MTATPIGIIVGTNRHNSFTKVIAQYYQKILLKFDQPSIIIDLSLLPEDFAFSALYHNHGKNDQFNIFQDQMDQCNKFVFVVPEYNSSFPGVLKTFLDGLRHPDSLVGKKIALVGLSAGVLGNAVGLSHLTDVLNYFNANVLGLRVKLGIVKQHFADGEFTSDIYRNFMERQAKLLIEF